MQEKMLPEFLENEQATMPLSPSMRQEAAYPMSRDVILETYRRIRRDSEDLCEPLAVEDYVIQTTVEASPAKWHIAHVTWFFETFILSEFEPDYPPFHPRYRYLFNSYYEQVRGGFFPRSQRGLLSRPTVEEIYRYRAHVDEYMAELITTAPESEWDEIAARLAIGLNHEQQHQELLLTDLKYNLGFNPLRPAYRENLPQASADAAHTLLWLEFFGGVRELGYAGGAFAYDNERPRHRVFVQPYRLASRLVTNGEYLEFIGAGGYRDSALWLSDGWKTIHENDWGAPLYWEQQDGAWWQYTLGGMRPLCEDEPLCHISYYEADAYATWAGKRLPTEAEWECAAAEYPMQGNLRDASLLHPAPAQGEGLQQLFGDVWEWTQTAYQPYPGFQTAPGALGEYNGKFMCNQQVMRGASCVTPADHARVTYRNFFYPHERWQFKGMRLAEDAR